MGDGKNGMDWEEPDYYGMYLEELKAIAPLGGEEEKQLLEELAAGQKEAGKRLTEGKLSQAARLAGEYADRGLPAGDLVQEANMALLMAVEEYTGGDFDRQMEERIRRSLEAALADQDRERRIGEEMAARVNVLKDISAAMAAELGREATVAELAERMKMPEEEIRDIMKLTLDAMRVIGE